MNKSFDGVSYRRSSGGQADKSPNATGFTRPGAVYVATGGETSIDLTALSTPITYTPSKRQLSVYRSSGGGKLIAGLGFFETDTSHISFPADDPLQAGEWVEIIKEFEIQGVLALAPSPNVWTEVATAGQTRISADFSWPRGYLPTKDRGAVDIQINGVSLARGKDYTEVVIPNSGYTNAVDLVDPLVGDENVAVVPQFGGFIDVSGSATTYQGIQISQVQEMLGAALDGFVLDNRVVAPFSLVQKRAMMQDFSNDLMPKLGSQRILTLSCYEIQGEYGPSGERVFGAVGDTYGQIRFVGNWHNEIQGYGTFIQNLPTVNDYVEFSFYGTGAMLLTYTSVNRTFVVSIDGQPEISINSPQYQGPIANRNLNANQTVTLCSGLAMGFHTVKVRNNGADPALAVLGFESVASNSIQVVNGKAYIGSSKYEVTTPASMPYNSGFAYGGSVGTKGGRVLLYMDANGNPKLSFQAADATIRAGDNSDHTNEDVIRIYDVLEFGENVTQDLQRYADSSGQPASGQFYFAMPDNAHNISSKWIRIFGGSLGNTIEFGGSSGSGAWFTIGFVGTGLDCSRYDATDGGAGTGDIIAVQVDGDTLATLDRTASTAVRTQKLVSGLPFGYHTVRFQLNGTGSAGRSYFGRFVVYGPKKPFVPSGAVELCDYNILGDFSSSTANGYSLSNPTNNGGSREKGCLVPTGVIAKSPFREWIYSGTWNIVDQAFAASSILDQWRSPWQYVLQTTQNGAVAEITFIGTGINIVMSQPSSGSQSFSAVIDGNSGTTWSAISGNLSLSGSGVNWTLNNGGGVGNPGGVLSCSNLSYGIHRLVITTTNANQFNLAGAYVITPFWTQAEQETAFDNNIVAGNSTMRDLRNMPIKSAVKKKKARGSAYGKQSGPSTTAVVPVPTPDMAVPFRSYGRRVKINWSIEMSNNTLTGVCNFQVMVDGKAVGRPYSMSAPGANYGVIVSGETYADVPAGFHVAQLFWSVGSGVMTASSTHREIHVEEES